MEKVIEKKIAKSKKVKFNPKIIEFEFWNCKINSSASYCILTVPFLKAISDPNRCQVNILSLSVRNFYF